jgi:spore coat polysaccharide biosynthesis protein SpsF (cytidylyltransferase family)
VAGADGMAPPIMIQARFASQRLPGKVLADLCGDPVLAWVVQRCRASQLAGAVAVLTSDGAGDDSVAALAAQLGAPVYRGSEPDVLQRYVDAARFFAAPLLVRITADCPFIDPAIIDEVIELGRRHPADYVCVRDYPEGIGAVELLRSRALRRVLERTTPAQTYYREHVMTYLVDHPQDFDLYTVAAPAHLQRPQLRFSIDTAEDLERARRLARFFHPARTFRLAEILAWADAAATP